jgi:hypothetical protein
VVDGGDDVEFEFAVAGRLEDARVDLDLLDSGAVQFFERGYDASLLSCSGGSVDKEMREVVALGLYGC